VLVPGRHRARSSRLRVTLPRCRPSPWCSPAAMPTSPTYPALAPVRPPDPWSSAAAAVQARPGACSGTRPYALPGPAVLHRVADWWLPPPFTTATRRRVEPESAGRAHPVRGQATSSATSSPGGAVALPLLRPQNAESQDRTGRRPGTAPARFLDPAATYNTVLTALRSTRFC